MKQLAVLVILLSSLPTTSMAQFSTTTTTIPTTIGAQVESFVGWMLDYENPDGPGNCITAGDNNLQEPYKYHRYCSDRALLTFKPTISSAGVARSSSSSVLFAFAEAATTGWVWVLNFSSNISVTVQISGMCPYNKATPATSKNYVAFYCSDGSNTVYVFRLQGTSLISVGNVTNGQYPWVSLDVDRDELYLCKSSQVVTRRLSDLSNTTNLWTLNTLSSCPWVFNKLGRYMLCGRNFIDLELRTVELMTWNNGLTDGFSMSRLPSGAIFAIYHENDGGNQLRQSPSSTAVGDNPCPAGYPSGGIAAQWLNPARLWVQCHEPIGNPSGSTTYATFSFLLSYDQSSTFAATTTTPAPTPPPTTSTSMASASTTPTPTPPPTTSTSMTPGPQTETSDTTSIATTTATVTSTTNVPTTTTRVQQPPPRTHTLTIPPVVEIPPPKQIAIKKAVEAVGISATILSIATAAVPALSFNMGRQRATDSITLVCTTAHDSDDNNNTLLANISQDGEDAAELVVLAHPTRMKLGTGPARFFLGAMVGNILIFVGGCVCFLFIGYYIECFKEVEGDDDDLQMSQAAISGMVPCFVALFCGFLLAPLLSSAINAAITTTSDSIRETAIVVTVIVVIFFSMSFYIVLYRRKISEKWVPAPTFHTLKRQDAKVEAFLAAKGENQSHSQAMLAPSDTPDEPLEMTGCQKLFLSRYAVVRRLAAWFAADGDWLYPPKPQQQQTPTQEELNEQTPSSSSNSSSNDEYEKQRFLFEFALPMLCSNRAPHYFLLDVLFQVLFGLISVLSHLLTHWRHQCVMIGSLSLLLVLVNGAVVFYYSPYPDRASNRITILACFMQSVSIVLSMVLGPEHSEQLFTLQIVVTLFLCLSGVVALVSRMSQALRASFMKVAQVASGVMSEMKSTSPTSDASTARFRSAFDLIDNDLRQNHRSMNDLVHRDQLLVNLGEDQDEVVLEHMEREVQLRAQLDNLVDV